MSSFPYRFEGILYTIVNESQKTLQVGNGNRLEDSNAVVDNIGPRLIIPETLYISNQYYIPVKISACAFRLSTQIEIVYLPPTIQELEFRAFDLASNLKYISFGYNSQLKRIGNGALLGTSIKFLYLPKTLEECEENCISRNLKMKALYYCGSYEFTSQNLQESNEHLQIFLVNTNPLSSLSTFSILKSADCPYPQFSFKCTLSSFLKETHFGAFLFSTLIQK